ncbi:hypothetical protein, partial [Inquilinus sp. OTU3971]|uniref:hypothetical protein n=1 Tax=Inquilinus sp. OTU3971 TaxID=3043855 RepID=UPI00313C6FC2
ITALRRWLEARGDAPGALFSRLDRGGNLVAGADGRMLPVDPATIARLVKRAIARTGVDAGEFSGHSLRAGMMTAADRLGVPFEQAMEELQRGPDLSAALESMGGEFCGQAAAGPIGARSPSAIGLFADAPQQGGSSEADGRGAVGSARLNEGLWALHRRVSQLDAVFLAPDIQGIFGFAVLEVVPPLQHVPRFQQAPEVPIRPLPPEHVLDGMVVVRKLASGKAQRQIAAETEFILVRHGDVSI